MTTWMKLRRRAAGLTAVAVLASAACFIGPQTQAFAAADPDAELIADLVTANRILADQGILDGFGHVSVRSAKNPSHFYMAWGRAPGMIVADDILEFDQDSKVLNDKGHRLYSERYIHGEIFRVRPDVLGIVHSHSPAVIPFGVGTTPLRPVSHMAGFLSNPVPVFEIRGTAGEDNGMLVNTAVLGAALAKQLGNRNVILMRGHGDVVAAQSLKHAVAHAIYTEFNAHIQSEALRLGTVTYLNEKEAVNAAATNDGSIDRPWEIWKAKALGTASKP